MGNSGVPVPSADVCPARRIVWERRGSLFYRPFSWWCLCWLSMESLPLSDRRLRSQHRGRRNCRFWSRLHSAGEPGWVGFGRVAWHASVWIPPWDLFRRVALQGGEKQLARLGLRLKHACDIAARGTVAYDTTIDVQHRLGLI